MVTTLKPLGPNEQLEHSRLTSLINSMTDAVIALDENEKVVVFNGAALDILDVNGITAGADITKLFRPVDAADDPVNVRELITSAVTPLVNRDLKLHYTDGSTINLYVSISPVHAGYTEISKKGHVLVLRDITREKSLEEERDEFISVVSHELRTPIAIAEGNIGNAEFLVEKSQDMNAIKQALKEAHNQTLFLADMINDLSTLSRAERGVLVIEPESINVHDLMMELASNYSAEAKAKNLAIKTQLDPNLELLESSKLYVREVLQNFITNALKYTKRGTITLAAKPGDNSVIFTVTDTGIGISKSDQARVFDKFFRSEDYRTRETSGTGLGLYVTAKLTRLLGAKITLESQLNHGSTFTIVIPNITTKD